MFWFDFDTILDKMSHNEKVFAKNGLLQTKSGKNTAWSKMLFQISKLRKKRKMKSIFADIKNKFSKENFTPFFANTLLSAVFMLIHLFQNTQFCFL